MLTICLPFTNFRHPDSTDHWTRICLIGVGGDLFVQNPSKGVGILMVFRACLGSSLRPSVWPSLSLWSGLWMANMFFPLKWIQLKQKQWNNMILKWHKSRFLFPSASCREIWVFFKKHRFKISHLGFIFITAELRDWRETASTNVPETHRSCMKAVPKILHFLWFCSPSSPQVGNRCIP